MATAITALFFLSCSSTSQGEQVEKETYFDIPGYFKAEIVRLTHNAPLLDKTVVKDSLSESKEIKIDHWENELSSFVSVDLNKPAYSGIFKKDSTENKVKITSLDPKTDIELVEITYDKDGNATEFLIHRNIENSLYDTRETLHYIKDSAYHLEKHQSVLALGDKYYRIEGIFKN